MGKAKQTDEQDAEGEEEMSLGDYMRVWCVDVLQDNDFSKIINDEFIDDMKAYGGNPTVVDPQVAVTSIAFLKREYAENYRSYLISKGINVGAVITTHIPKEYENVFPEPIVKDDNEGLREELKREAEKKFEDRIHELEREASKYKALSMECDKRVDSVKTYYAAQIRVLESDNKKLQKQVKELDHKLNEVIEYYSGRKQEE